MATLLSIPSILGATCSQSSSADCHLYSNVLAYCTDFDAQSRSSFCGASNDICTTHCGNPSRVGLRINLSVSARARSGLAEGAKGWQDVSVRRRLNGAGNFGASREANRLKLSESAHYASLRGTGDDVFQVSGACLDKTDINCLSNRVLKSDKICTPLTLLTSSVGTLLEFERFLLGGKPREFWIVHVLLSGLVPTLVGWQLLQYSCGLLDGWFLPTKHRSLGTKIVYKPKIIGGISRQHDEYPSGRSGLLPVEKLNSQTTFLLEGDHQSQKIVSRLSSESKLPRLLHVLPSLKVEVADFLSRLTSRRVPVNSRRGWSTFSGGSAPFLLCSLGLRGFLLDLLKLFSRSPERRDPAIYSGTRRWQSNVAICRLVSWLSCISRRTHVVEDDFQGRAFVPIKPMFKLIHKIIPPTAVAQCCDPGVDSSYLLDMGFFSWFKRMSSTYGTSLMGLVVMGYWIQGFRSFPWLAVSFLFKDGLQVDPSTMQFIFSSASLPMVAKPIYGIMSDALYIGGCHRLPYLAIAASLQALSWGAIVMNPGSTTSLGVLTVLLAVSNMGAAIAEVMNDALVAEAGKKDPNSTGELQSLSWIALATGGVVGSLCGGLALRRIDSHAMFSIFLLMVSAQLIVCFTVSEQSFGLASTRREEGARGLTGGSWLSFLKIKGRGFLANLQKQKTISLAEMNGTPAARLVGDGLVEPYIERVDYRDTGPRDIAETVNVEGQSFEMKSKCQGGAHVDDTTFLDRPIPIGIVREQFAMLMQLIRKPEIRGPLMWFVASYAMIPTLGSSLFFFQTQELHIDPAFLGLQKVVGQLGLMAGSVMFNRYLKQLPLRKVVAFVHCLLCFCMLSDFLLVTRINLLLGIRDELFVLGVSAFVEAVAQFKVLLFMVLLAQLCPAGSEGSLLAFFMSAHCLANTFSAYLGVALASYLQISSNNFTYLPLGIFVQAMAALVPITLIGLIPENPRAPPQLTKVEKVL